MPKTTVTAERIGDEIDRRIRALPAIEGWRPGAAFFRPLPADADRNGGCNWTIGEGLDAAPWQVQATVRQVMDFFELSDAPRALPGYGHALARHARAGIAFREWEQLAGGWRHVFRDFRATDEKSVEARGRLLAQLGRRVSEFVRECKA